MRSILMKKMKKVFSFRDVSLIILASSLVMCFLGASLVYKHLGGVNFSLLGEDANLKEFISAYNNLVDNYYDSLDSKELINGAIEGMYDVVGDPYTTYLDDDSSSNLDDSLNGKYEGIGISVPKEAGNEEGMLIIDVQDNSPASKAELMVGDIITKINGESAVGRSSAYLTDLIKKSESVNLEVMRDGNTWEVHLNVETLNYPVVSSEVLVVQSKKIGYLKLTIFNDTADIQVANHLSKLEKENIEGLILDLRDNSGGYLQIAQNIAEMFLEKGKVIYSLESKDSKKVTKDETSEKRTYPIAVVVNRSSASASEILAAALKYSYGADIVGTTTFGKGKVQEKSVLSGGTNIKYTTAKWLTPADTCIDGIGIVPTIEISVAPEFSNPSNIYDDIQVMAALNNFVD